ncbi:hypothetical protein KUTeg_014599 [Tegillarca granosa]|uniref:Uncharacterized protein n=1 Tax=Tegillarca granosa TaxID=220873 RepID=A0ABQ9ETZ0_TEGGR|nr:hypothetical protein KUTeg_014599 [Tegillarca granosa]
MPKVDQEPEEVKATEKISGRTKTASQKPKLSRNPIVNLTTSNSIRLCLLNLNSELGHLFQPYINVVSVFASISDSFEICVSQQVTSLGEVFNDEEEEEEEDGSSDFDNEEDTDVNHDNDNELELPLKPLVKDETVRIKLNGLWKPATVLEEVAPRSYKVRTEDGRYLRRNRKDLLKSNEGPIAHFEPNVLKADSSIADSDRSHDILTNSPEVLPSTNVRMPISIDNKPTIPVSNPIPPDKPHYVTKSGRQVKPKALHGIMRRPTSITPPPKRIKRKAPLDDVSLYIHRAR